MGHGFIERADSMLDEVVHRQGGDAVGFERERPEALLGELREQLVADLPERGFPVVGLPEGHEVV